MKEKLFFLACALAIAADSGAQTAEFKNPSELAKSSGYSHVVVVNRGKLVLISGQTGLNSKGEMAGDFVHQTRQAFANLNTALAAAGATPANIVKLNYYVVGLNRDRLLSIREVRDGVIDKQHPPASTLVGVQALFREDALIEIEGEAALP